MFFKDYDDEKKNVRRVGAGYYCEIKSGSGTKVIKFNDRIHNDKIHGNRIAYQNRRRTGVKL